MKSQNKIKIVALVTIGVFCVFVFSLPLALPAKILTADAAPALVNLETADDCTTKEECQTLLNQYEKLLTQYESDIQKTQGQKDSLKKQIQLLKQKEQALSVQIKQSNAVISDLSLQISDTEKSIAQTQEKIRRQQNNLAQILRVINDEDQRPLIEILLSEASLSTFFDDLVYLQNLNDQSARILQDVKNLKANLEDQQAGLEIDKNEMEKTVKMQTLQKQQHEANQSQQEKTLKLTESQYQQQVTKKKATEQEIQKIRNKIFQLAGLGADQETLTFGEAVTLAKKTAALVGIRPAFLLAILTQESNIGQNVGQCYLKNKTTGSGIKITTGATMAKVMNPTRDVPHFLTITGGVGRDPLATRVSCPMSYGWGGAMGPAQFIPSTWVKYQDRITAITGRPADPWNNNDAFLAAALYVSDYGAKSKTYNGEWKAAMIYFSGSTNTKYRFYGDNVIAIEKDYENDIALIGE